MIPDRLLISLARKDFWSFCVHWDREFFLERRPFLFDIADALQKIADGEIKTLSISLPPRAGKSFTTSLFCAWMIGRKPEGSVMRNSATARLYQKFSYDVRSFIKDDRFRKVFPNVELSEDKTSVDGWNVKQAIQVTYFGSGVTGSPIGFGASLVAITDDLYRGHEDAISDTINDKVHFFYDSAHLSRLEKGCAKIDIGTRWSNEDVIGKNIEDGIYDLSIIVPALVEDRSFCEDVKTTDEYLDLKKITDPFIWDSEYMQQPVQLEGVVFPTDKIQYYDHLTDVEQAIDVYYADTADEGEDYYCGVHGKLIGGLIYIVDVTMNTGNLTDNEPILLAKISQTHFSKIYIESNSFGASFIRNIRKESTVPIRGVKNVMNKMLRIIAESGFILQNFRFPKQSSGSEYDIFFRQIKSILKTGAKHDDAPDALAGLSMMVRRDFLHC